MSPADARDAARRKLGNQTLVREEIYQMNTMTLIDSAWRDLRYGARLLRLNPGVRDRRDPVAGARRRRQHRDLSAARRGPPADAAGRGRRSELVEIRIAESTGRPHRAVLGPAAEPDQPAVGADPRSAAGVLERVRLEQHGAST